MKKEVKEILLTGGIPPKVFLKYEPEHPHSSKQWSVPDDIKSKMLNWIYNQDWVYFGDQEEIKIAKFCVEIFKKQEEDKK